MGIGVSLFLIAIGAVLAFAVNATTSGIDVHTVGWILMAVGLAGMLLSMMFWSSWGGFGGYRRTRYAAGPGVPVDRTRTVEREYVEPY